jgi:hypothetical protein
LGDTEGVLYSIEAQCPKKGQMYTEGVVCVEVDQGITSSKNDIVDIYREKSQPEN